jgi:hypothetical protein
MAYYVKKCIYAFCHKKSAIREGALRLLLLLIFYLAAIGSAVSR